MYSLVSAMAKSFASEGRWESVDIGEMSFATLYSTYTRVIAVLTNPFIDGQVALDLASIAASVGNSQRTFNQFLTDNANNTLPTFTPVPVLQQAEVHYMDARRAGYKVERAGPPNVAPDAVLPDGDKTCAYLTKKGLDFRTFGKYALVTINDFLHRVVFDQNGAWVIDAAKSLMKSGYNQVGILNFQKVSALTTVPVTADMIYKSNDTELYRNYMRVDLGQDISNKSVMLSLGGYLHVLDEKTFYRINDTSVVIDFNNLPLLERYHESLPYLDYSSLPFDRSTSNDSQVPIDSFFSDANLLAYMQLSQTFFIIGDNPEIYKDTKHVQTIGHSLVAFEKPKWPLVSCIGRLQDYWYTDEDGQWGVSVTDNRWQHRLYDTVKVPDQQNVDAARITQDRASFSRAFFLLIGTDIMLTP
jgi:hypothetical protein